MSKPRYIAACLGNCYNTRKEFSVKKDAERWCTQHMSAYGHDCTVIDRKEYPNA